MRTLLTRLGIYAALAVLVTWPLVTNPGGLVVGGDRTDVWNSLWGLWYAAQAGVIPSTTTLLDFPGGGRLALADPLNALLALPMIAFLGPVTTYAVLVLGHLTFSGLAADALGRACGGQGWIAGIGYQLAPIGIAHLQNGSSEALATGWLPLAALAIISVVKHGGLLRMVWAACTLILCAIGGWYAGINAWIVLLVVLIFGVKGHPFKQRLKRLVLPMLIAMAVTLPVASSIKSVALAEDGLVDIKKDDDLSRIRRTLGSADPRTFVRPGEFRSPDFSALQGNPSDYIHTTYLGLSLVFMAAVATWRRREDSGIWWAAGISGGILAMGPVVVWNGHPLSLAGNALPMPFLILESFPGFSSLSLLWRLASICALSLAVLADRLNPKWIVIVLVELMLIAPTKGLPEVSAVYEYPALQAIPEDADGGLLNLPPTASRSALYEQVLHQRPMVNSLNAGTNLAGLKIARAARAVWDREGTWETVVEVAKQQQIAWVVHHKDIMMNTTHIQASLVFREHAELVAEDDRVKVYRIW